MRDIMLDIETLGTTPGCVILSIGAVEFDDTTTYGKFSVHIDPIDAVRHGMHIDASTVMWWLDQSKEAQNALLNAEQVPLCYALLAFADTFDWKNSRVWCNGAAFDFPILGAAFKAANMKQPWAYYNEMDMRTIKGLVGKEAWKTHAVKPTIAHDGLADAIAQARTLQNVFANDKGVRWAITA